MGIIKEFREFAIKGNVIDLAVGVVIGAAFGKIVSSLVDDVITPAILTPALTAANLTELNQLVIPGTAIKYGNFLSEVLAFVIVAFVLFILIKGVNRINKKDKEAEAVVPPVPSKEELLLSEIRDILKAK
ncbi:large-conductance mechanosensitive channel [Pedobacter glucosidilyticus]|nr:large-conductance mechanosensitive channel protein MscL [Pedobacter glucosidilyticus]KHJ39703.1 large-conductance mechanosensitive channel [Pedobacter glucosidilyticus]